MFTGLIEDIGTLKSLIPSGRGARLLIGTSLPMEEVKRGDSIAVCGACLTVVSVQSGQFEAEISRETAARSTLSAARPGEHVHLERAMRLSDRLDGHLVMGHVDGVGHLKERRDQGDSIYLRFTAPESIIRYLIEKGSIAVHGVSLTLNEVFSDGFSVTIVPFTQSRTLLTGMRLEAAVNLEADIIGKYVERLLAGGKASSGQKGLSLDTLARAGYLT